MQEEEEQTYFFLALQIERKKNNDFKSQKNSWAGGLTKVQFGLQTNRHIITTTVNNNNNKKNNNNNNNRNMFKY